VVLIFEGEGGYGRPLKVVFFKSPSVFRPYWSSIKIIYLESTLHLDLALEKEENKNRKML
jgi:hypothetical protein